MYDLVCVLPLYGKDCKDVSLRMISSIALQKTKFKVKYLFYYDDSVDAEAIQQVSFLLRGRDFDIDIIHTKKSCSGYKRNLGLRYAEKNAKYVWLLDQDDYLEYEDAIDIILNYCLKENPKILKLLFRTPSYLDEQNTKIIHSIPTMPWQYVVRTDLLDGISFKEDNEYGSDISYSIQLLVKNKYAVINDELTMNYVELPPICSIPLYYYNYLNKNSYMGNYAMFNDQDMIKQQDYGYAELRKIKEKYENN